MVERQVIDFENFKIAGSPSLGRYEYREAKVGLFDHAHLRALEICFLAKGRQMYRVGKQDFLMRGGDVFVTFPGEEHSTGGAPQEKGILYWFLVTIPSRREGFLGCSLADSRALVRELRSMPHRHFAGEPVMQDELDEMIALSSESPTDLNRVRLQTLFISFLLRVIRCSTQAPTQTVSPAMSAMLRYVEANVHQDLPLPVLAARMELSLPRFKARFKQEVGVPPAEYVLRCKIEEAKRRLAKGRQSVLDVAVALNFSSSQYFATVFRRYTGKTPTQFAARAGSTSDDRI